MTLICRLYIKLSPVGGLCEVHMNSVCRSEEITYPSHIACQSSGKHMHYVGEDEKPFSVPVDSANNLPLLADQ